eukprot:scaffold135279_cov45-Prasinocladus_malaysianus.AAC.4
MQALALQISDTRTRSATPSDIFGLPAPGVGVGVLDTPTHLLEILPSYTHVFSSTDHWFASRMYRVDAMPICSCNLNESGYRFRSNGSGLLDSEADSLLAIVDEDNGN